MLNLVQNPILTHRAAHACSQTARGRAHGHQPHAAVHMLLFHTYSYLKPGNDVPLQVPPAEGRKVISHMLLSTFKAGHEWDPYSDQQVSHADI